MIFSQQTELNGKVGIADCHLSTLQEFESAMPTLQENGATTGGLPLQVMLVRES